MIQSMGQCPLSGKMFAHLFLSALGSLVYIIHGYDLDSRQQNFMNKFQKY